MDHDAKIAEFLDKYDAATQNINLDNICSERALYYLLKQFQNELPSMEYGALSFQKTFRQTDVTSSGKIDMAIWQLLHCCELAWSLIEGYNLHASE